MPPTPPVSGEPSTEELRAALEEVLDVWPAPSPEAFHRLHRLLTGHDSCDHAEARPPVSGEPTTGYEPRDWYSLDEANAYRDGYDDAMEHIEARATPPSLDVDALSAALKEQHAVLMPDVPPMSQRMLDHIVADLAQRYARLTTEGEKP